LLLDERVLDDGRIARVWALLVGETLQFEDDSGPSGALPIAALERVMERYGRELEPSVVLDGEVLPLPEGRQLQRLRHHTPVDAIARDYLVWHRRDQPPLAVLATHATGALQFLLRSGHAK
jgi:hypothetical protein